MGVCAWHPSVTIGDVGQFLLVAAVALTAAAIVFGIAVLLTGDDEGLRPVEPDGVAVPLPNDRPLTERDLTEVRFDTALRGYRMAQVDAALRRAAYDLGYKEELINVLQAEVEALRAGRFADAEAMRRARQAALAPARPATGAGDRDRAAPGAEPAGPAPQGGSSVHPGSSPPTSAPTGPSSQAGSSPPPDDPTGRPAGDDDGTEPR